MIKFHYPITLRRRLKELQPQEPAPAIVVEPVKSSVKKGSTKSSKDNG